MDWIRLDLPAMIDVDWLDGALDRFSAPDPDREADEYVAGWLSGMALNEHSPECWVLLDPDTESVAAFHTTQVSSVTLAGKEMPALHVAQAGRSGAHPRAGGLLIEHLITLCEEGGLTVVTLDPHDAANEKPWRRHGFRETQTPVQNDQSAGHNRLYLPI